MTARFVAWSARRYLANVHRYPVGVTLEGCAAWAGAWLLAHGRR